MGRNILKKCATCQLYDLLHQNAYEATICMRHCDGLDQFCVLRYLKHYQPKKKNEKSKASLP